jgi:hypothetical protein
VEACTHPSSDITAVKDQLRDIHNTTHHGCLSSNVCLRQVVAYAIRFYLSVVTSALKSNVWNNLSPVLNICATAYLYSEGELLVLDTLFKKKKVLHSS